MKRSRILLLSFILLVSIFLLVIFRKHIEGFASRRGRNSSQRATFYTETRYKGLESDDLEPGKYKLADMIANKVSQKIKSFKSHGDIQIRLYPQDNFNGSPSVYKSSKPSLDIDFDVKSIIILEGKNTVYQDVSPPMSSLAMSSSAMSSPTMSSSMTLPPIAPVAPVTRQPEIPQASVTSPVAGISQSVNYVLLRNIVPSNNITPASYSPTLI